LHRPTLVEQQHEELLAHEFLESRECETPSGVLARVPEKVETALVHQTIGHAYVEERAQQRFARPSFGNAVAQFVNPLANKSKVCGICAGRPLGTRIGRSEANDCLQMR